VTPASGGDPAGRVRVGAGARRQVSPRVKLRYSLRRTATLFVYYGGLIVPTDIAVLHATANASRGETSASGAPGRLFSSSAGIHGVAVASSSDPAHRNCPRRTELFDLSRGITLPVICSEADAPAAQP